LWYIEIALFQTPPIFGAHVGSDYIGFSTRTFVMLCSTWQDFNWHSASRGPSAIAEPFVVQYTQNRMQVTQEWSEYGLTTNAVKFMQQTTSSLLEGDNEYLLQSVHLINRKSKIKYRPIIQTHPSLLQTQARRCSVKTSWLTDCCSPCHTSISHFRYTSVPCHLGSILIAGALFSDLTVIRVHISAIRQPHIWQDEFWRLTCKMPLKSAAISFAICCRPSVCRLSVVCLSFVTFVRHTQAAQILGNISTAFGTLTIHWHPLKISRRSSQGNPSAGGVKHKRGSQV